MGRSLVGLLLLAVLVGLGWLWTREGRAVAGSAALPEAEGGESAPGPAELVAPDSVARTPAAPARPALESELPARQPDATAASATLDELVVKVVDPAGSPLEGIPVRLECTADDPGASSVPRPLVTDSAGHARFPGIRPVLENAERPWTLRHDLPFAEPPRVTLDRRTLSAREVVSVLPWGGAIEVVVRDFGDKAAPEESTVQLELLRAEDLLNPVPAGPEWTTSLRSGKALFPWVELGRTWEVSAWRPYGTIPSRLRTLGPRAAEETVRLEILLGADHPLASFRAVDVDGKPFASVPLELVRRYVFGFGASSRVETDPEGRFLVDGEATPFENRAFVVTYRPASGPALQGRASLPESASLGWNDCGDVVLEAEPLLCAGRVVDERGNPVREADVVAGLDLDSGRSSGRSGTTRGRTDERGRFELRGLWDEGDFELRAEQHSSKSDTVRARQGERDVRLVLSARYRLSGQFLVDAGIDPRSIDFQLETPGREAVSADRQRDLFENSQDGRFALEPVPAGGYELICLLDSLELTRIEGLSLREDTDVGRIDLRGRIQLSEIVLLGAQEPEKLKGEFDWTPHGADEWHTGRFEGELLKIVTPTAPIDVLVRPRGHRHARLEGVTGRRELLLEPPLRVRLVLRTDGEFPVLPYVFSCDLRQDGRDVGEPRGMRYFTKDSREIALDVAVAGLLRVDWHLERRVDGVNLSGSRGGNVLQESEVEIEVLDVPGEQVFQVQLDGAVLTALAHDPPW